jgi:hypothetical protein
LTSDTAHLKELAVHVGDVLAKLLAVQSDLFQALNQSDGAQAALLGFFCQPVPVRLDQALKPWQQVSTRVQVGFEESADVHMMVQPKVDHSISPRLNPVTIRYRGQSQYLCIAAWCGWTDVEAVQGYQLGVYGVPDRTVSCRAVLRLPKKGGGEGDVQFSSFDLRPRERAWHRSGALHLPDDMEVDRERHPLLLLIFDTRGDLEIRLDYISVYFE